MPTFEKLNQGGFIVARWTELVKQAGFIGGVQGKTPLAGGSGAVPRQAPGILGFEMSLFTLSDKHFTNYTTMKDVLSFPSTFVAFYTLFYTHKHKTCAWSLMINFDKVLKAWVIKNVRN